MIFFEASLWPTANQMDKQVLEILEIMMHSIAEMGFYLVPVLSNYWMYAGGLCYFSGLVRLHSPTGLMLIVIKARISI